MAFPLLIILSRICPEAVSGGIQAGPASNNLNSPMFLHQKAT